MMNEQTIFTLARFLTCGIWVGAGIYKVFHYRQTLQEMAHNAVPLAQLFLLPVLMLELIGSLMLATNTYVWAVALLWIAFILVATPFYHMRFYTPEGEFVFPQMVQTTKNISIVGGLLCLILLDPTTPTWLLARATS